MKLEDQKSRLELAYYVVIPGKSVAVSFDPSGDLVCYKVCVWVFCINKLIAQTLILVYIEAMSQIVNSQAFHVAYRNHTHFQVSVLDISCITVLSLCSVVIEVAFSQVLERI